MSASSDASSWKTMVIDAVGFAAVIWMIPVAIMVVGAPIALLFVVARWIFG
jgi:hypothetical protein